MLPRISRRDFLQRAALLSAALALPGRDLPALGADAPHTNAPLDIFSYGVTVVSALHQRQLDNTHAVLMGLNDDALMKPFRAMSGLPDPGEDLRFTRSFLRVARPAELKYHAAAMTPRLAAKPAASSADLDTVFDELKAILSRYATSFTVREGAVKNKRDYHLIVQKPLVIDGRKKDELWFASVIQQKHNVGFYFMPLCCCTKLQDCRIEVKALISPELLKHLDGKCCFHMKSLTPELKKDIDAALKLGFAAYKKQKWL